MKRCRWPWLLPILLICNVSHGQMDAYGLAARVNGVPITNQTLEHSFQEFLQESGRNIAAIRYPEVVKDMRRQTLDLLIDQELVWQAAQRDEVIADDEAVERAIDSMRANFTTPEAFERKLLIEGYTMERYREHVKHLVSARMYLDRLSEKIEVSDAEVHEFYTQNPQKMRLPEAVRARHILIKPTNDSDETAVRERLGKLLGEARDGADFAELARRHSQDASAARGGDLGYFTRGRMVAAFEEAAFSLKAGEYSDIVKTPFGLHLIKVEDHRPESQLPENEVSETIRKHLREQKSQQAVQDTMESLRANAEIEILSPL